MEKSKNRILVIIDQLAFGGAGRVASILLNGLLRSGYDVSVETQVDLGINYPLSSGIKIFSMENHNGFVHRIKHHRKLLNEIKPDLIISFLPPMYLDALIASMGTGIPIIASDHTSMSRNLGLKTNFIRHYLYGLCAATTILTEKDKRILGNKIKNKVVVYNPLSFEPLDNFDTIGRNKTILCAGRIDSWDVKGFDRIIKIFSTISCKYSDWKLQIAGPGSNNSQEYLKSIAESFNVQHSIEFLGDVRDMKSLYQQTAIFALPSRVEGFPMVFIEAMSQGCACISFDLEGALSEIANNDEDCLIIPDNDISEFENKLDKLVSSENLRKNLGNNATKMIRKYSEEKFINKWLSIINNII